MRGILALVFTLGVVAAVPMAPIAVAPALGATPVRTCGYIRASVPYSAHGRASRWRVYVKGAASCARAEAVLDEVMHLKGTSHEGRTEAGSYFTFAGWVCPFGLMGEQTCELPTRLPDHAPIRAHAEALECTGAHRTCPAQLPESAL